LARRRLAQKAFGDEASVGKAEPLIAGGSEPPMMLDGFTDMGQFPAGKSSPDGIARAARTGSANGLGGPGRRRFASGRCRRNAAFAVHR